MDTNMINRRLGQTDIRVSPIGLGCWQFSGGQGLVGRYWPALEPSVVRDIVEASLEAGVNWFDTAEAYGGGASERALAGALRELGIRPGEVVVATKWMPVLRTARSIPRTIDRRLEALGEYPIDLYQIHNPYSLSSLEAQLREMAALRKAGRIRAVGVSNFSAEQVRRAHRLLAGEGIPLASNQVRYSLVDRDIEGNGVLEAARELGVTIIAYSPLAQGILGGVYHEDPRRIRERPGMRKRQRAFRPEQLEQTRPLIEQLRLIGGAHGASPAEVALAWLSRAHGDTVVAIPGASSAEQARRNAAAMSLELDGEELESLTRLSAVPQGAGVA
jgi:aryl-alcohol dehydrogenase-like predicted oxidoreductase